MAPRSWLDRVMPLLFLAVFGMLIAGCGDDDADSPTSTPVVDIEELEGLSTQLADLNNQLDGLLNSLSSEVAVDSLLTILSSNPAIESAGKSSQGLWVRYHVSKNRTVAGAIILDPEFFSSDSLGKGNPVFSTGTAPTKALSQPTSVKTLYIAPVYSEMQEVIAGVVDNVVAQVNPALQNAGYQPFELLTDDDCTVDLFAELDTYGIVRIHSHGSPWPSNESTQRVYTPTGEVRSTGTDEKYFNDLMSGNLAWTVRNGQTYYYVSAGFVGSRNNFSDENTFVSLGFSYGSEGGWPDAVTVQGESSASTGFDWVVSGDQERDWAIDFFTSMCNTALETPMTIADWFGLDTYTAPGGSQVVTMASHGDGATTFWSVELESDLDGSWAATVIEGSLDPQGNPLDVDGSVSTIEFRSDQTYTWFLHAPPWFDVDGNGTYTHDGNTIQLTGIINELGVSSIAYSGGDSFTFLDDDGDRWTYEQAATGGSTASPISSIVVEPASPVADVGDTIQFSAMASFVDGSQGDVTDLVDWSGPPDVVEVGNGESEKGRVVVLIRATAPVTARDPETKVLANAVFRHTDLYYLRMDNIRLNNRGSSVEVSPGEFVEVVADHTLWSRVGCSSCVDYIVVGIEGDAQRAVDLGLPGNFPGASGSASYLLTAPEAAGTYTIYARLAPVLSTSAAIGDYESFFPGSNGDRPYIPLGTIVVE